jgi:hypothetical protein
MDEAAVLLTNVLANDIIFVLIQRRAVVCPTTDYSFDSEMKYHP